jgi:hypothetical protein
VVKKPKSYPRLETTPDQLATAMLKLGVAQTVVSKMEALLQQITTSGFCF